MTQYENLNPGAKRVLDFADEPTGTSKAKEMVAEYFDVEEALTQLKTTLKAATDFVQRRPVLVFASACALGLVGTLAFMAKKRIH